MRPWQTFTAAIAGLIVASGFLLCTTASGVAQQRPTEEQILNALKPPPQIKTRALTQQSRQAAEDKQFLATIRKVKTRQLTAGERERVASIAKSKPSIDLEIYFDYNSSSITSTAEPDLMSLGRALTNPDLRGSVFLIAGHTDGKGGAEFNQRLSERRAAAVKKFLQEKFDLQEDTLVIAGYGKEQLKNSSDPYASENRRVQIVNLEQRTASGR